MENGYTQHYTSEVIYNAVRLFVKRLSWFKAVRGWKMEMSLSTLSELKLL